MSDPDLENAMLTRCHDWFTADRAPYDPYSEREDADLIDTTNEGDDE